MTTWKKAAATAAVLALTLTGCSALEQARQGVSDAQAYADSVREEVGRASDLTLEELRGFDFQRLDEYAGTLLSDDGRVAEFMRSMPTGEDMAAVEIRGGDQGDGTLVVTYGDRVLEADPAVLRQSMEELAAQAKERVQSLETVEFRVGETTYTF